MSPKIAINGFGRIGRLFLRDVLQEKCAHVVAINDIVLAENLAYLFKYDTVHGRYKGKVEHTDSSLIIDGIEIPVYAEKDPAKLPWEKHQVDFVVESTGLFKTPEKAGLHLEAGAKRVVISAPAKGEIPTFVMGVNHKDYDPKSHLIVSNASCTTNCLAPISKILLDNFGIEEGLMTTIHALTASQSTVDAPSARDFRAGRAGSLNVIPASTGAAKAVTLCLPSLKGKLTGMAMRVPVVDVSVVDLTVRLTRETSYEEICAAVKTAAEEEMKDILCYCDEDVVSSDFIGSSYSCIFDAKAGIELNSKFFKLICWYDNEMGYAKRVTDLVLFMSTKE
jgi:glyceraldehyde 3-phosphate dehydrogenase